MSQVQPPAIPALESKHWRSTSQTAAVIGYPAIEKLVYLSRNLARRERVDDAELGMEKLGVWALMATLDDVKPHRLALQSRVILDSHRAVMSSHHLCGTPKPDTAHIVHEVEVRDAHGEMQRVGALIDCVATSILSAPRLRRRLGIRDEPALTATVGLDGRVMVEAKDSRKATISVRYLDQLAPVEEPEVFIVPMRA
jgi:hypothetical protein